MIDVPRVLRDVEPAFRIDSRAELAPHALEREYVSRSRPVVLRGAMRGSTALSWSIETLRDLAPTRQIPVASYRSGNVYDMRDRFVRETSIAAYAETLRAARSADEPYPYLVGDVARYFPELLAEVRLPYFLDAKHQAALDLIVGKDSVAGAHFHAWAHGLLSQALGRKIVLLHPPSEARHLYPHTVVHPYYCHSRARFDQPRRFPRLAKARAAVATLEQGDALFIPAGWWHTVFAVGETISISYFWKTRRLRQRVARPFLRNALGLLFEPTLHRLLARSER